MLRIPKGEGWFSHKKSLSYKYDLPLPLRFRFKRALQCTKARQERGQEGAIATASAFIVRRRDDLCGRVTLRSTPQVSQADSSRVVVTSQRLRA